MPVARQTAATAVLLAIACFASISVIGAPEIGALAPDFTAENYVTGEKVRLSAQQGKITVVTFWATWCAPCREELPNLEKLQRYLGKEKIAVLAISFKDTPETIRRLRSNAKKAGWNINMLLDPDGRIAHLYDVKAIPRMYLIGKDGKIRATHVGFGDGSLEEMVDDLNAVLGEGAATPPAPQSP
jgi:peroxiredoxin